MKRFFQSLIWWKHCVLALVLGLAGRAVDAEVLLPGLISNLVCRYDFEHAVATNAALENDLGFSGTTLQFINGGAAMRNTDGAYPGSIHSLQTQQVNPDINGNDDWKAGVYQTNGLASLSAFAAVREITLMGWVKPTGTNPNLKSSTPATNDYYNAIGLFGLLSGASEGHGVRALLEVLTVSGNLRLVALGRRLDSGSSLTLATTNDWQTLLPPDVWTHLAATFDFDAGIMALYRNGQPLPAGYTTTGDAWGVGDAIEPGLTSATSPAGIKIGGSYPQNTQEFNACNGRFDDLMFFNRVLTAGEVLQQYASFFAVTGPVLSPSLSGNQITLRWPIQGAAFILETKTNLTGAGWIPAVGPRLTNSETISVTLPAAAAQEYFRLTQP